MAITKFSWRNSDGLNVFFGPTEGTSGTSGSVKTYGDNAVLTQIINLADLTTTAQYLDQHAELPKGALIEKVEIAVLTVAASSGTGTLNVGLSQSDQTTNISDTALVAAATTAALAAGALITINVGTPNTFLGANVGTVLSVNGLLTAKAGTAVFQSGKVEVRIYYNFVK